MSRAEAELEALLANKDKIEASIVEVTSNLEAARAAQVQADEAVAAIHAEFVPQSIPFDAGPGPPCADAVQAAEGLEVQLGALPAALAAGNAMDSVLAIQRQCAALVSSMCGNSCPRS